MISWNVGSAFLHRDEISGISAKPSPHIFCIQECKLGLGELKAFSYELQPLGFDLILGQGGLCAIVRRGLNVAPISRGPADSDFRVQRLAL